MPSGYEKSPDYGSDTPSPVFSFVVFLLIIFVISPIAWWYMTRDPHANCRVITAAETETIEEDGKIKGRLDLRKLDLKAGECLTLRP